MDPSATITPTVSSGYPSASSILESVPSGSCGNGAGVSLISRPVVDGCSRDGDDEGSSSINPLARRQTEEEPQHDGRYGGDDEEEEGCDHNHDEHEDKYNLVNNVDVCVTTISAKPPTLPLREELPSLGVELVYNAKGTGMRGVRRTYRDAKRRPPPVPHVSSGVGKKASNSKNAGGGGLRKVVRQTRLGRRILRTGSSGSLQSMVGGGAAPSSPTGTGTSIVSPPKKAAISYETYHRTTLRSPGSSVASSFKDDQESIATHSTGVCSEGDDAASLDKIDEGTGLVPEQDIASYCRQERRKKWEDMEASNPALGGDEGPEEDAGLSYNFNESSSSNAPVSGPTTTMAAVAASPPPTRTSDNIAPPTPPATPMQKIEEWSEALRNVCCFGYLNLSHKGTKSDKDEHTAPLLGISPSQDSDMQDLLDKMEEENIPAGFLQDVGIGHGPNQAHAADNFTVITEEIQEEEEEDGQMYENELFALLSQYDARPEEAKELLNGNPEMASVVLQGTGRMALHELCDRGLPLDPWVFLPDGDNDDDEQPGKDNDAGVSESKHQNNDDNARRLLDGLLGDVTNLRILLKVVAWANVKACGTKDSNSDLPLHILARRLVEWEKSWNNDDVRYFCDPSDISNSARITTIYRTMAECLEVVLRPVGEDRELCMTGGSCNVLPLHIGALFGVSYDVLRVLLEQAPIVAHIPCTVHNDLNSTSSESEILPLTLLEQREVEQTYSDPSTDAPQSAAARGNNSSNNFSVGIQWSSSALESGPISNDFVLKSDLLFAYNPNILPQRKEAARLRRIESMVRSEAMQKNAGVDTFRDKKLSFAIESVWLFMCTFTNQVDESDHYADTVRCIVDGLDSVSLLKLVAITDNGGRELLDVANPNCASVIKDSLQEAVQTGSSSPRCTSPSSHASQYASPTSSQASQKSILKKSKVENSQVIPIDCKDSNAASTMEICNEIGRLCKTVFRLKKDDVPTSFIILPYKMKEEVNGQIALASSKDAGLAMKFAHSLVKLTDPHAILYALEMKFHERRGCPSDLASALSSKQKEEIENDLVVFLSLYTSNIGYLYLLDERTGVPMIKNTVNGPSTYPIIISNAYATVDKLLPLMQMGMTLMRGEVALKVLGQVICLGANTISPRSWVGVSQDIAKLMYCGQRAMHLSDDEKDKLMNLRDKLVQYASTMSAKVQKEGLGFEDGSEWVVEMSFLRTVLEKFDGRRSYAGLKPIKDHGRIIWTRQVESSDQAGDIKIPGDYVEARYRYDAFIHTSINVNQEQGSEVSSMTSAYFEESSEASQSQSNEDEDKVPAVIIQTLSAVCEEEMDESSGDGEARGDKAAATTESEGERVSPTNASTDPVQHESADLEKDVYAEITANSNTDNFEVGQTAEVLNGSNDEAETTDPTGLDSEGINEITESTAKSGESSSSRGTYTAVLEALGFDMYNNGQTEEEKDYTDTTNLSPGEEIGDDDLSSEDDEKPQISHSNETHLTLSLDEAHVEESTPNGTKYDRPKSNLRSCASTSSDQIIAAFIEEAVLSIDNGDETLVSPTNTEFSSFCTCNATGADLADLDNLASEVNDCNNLSFDLSEGEEEDRSRSALSLILNEDHSSLNGDDDDKVNDSPTAEGDFSNFCAFQVKSRIADGVDSYERLHPGTQSIKFILMGRADAANDKSVDSGVTRLSILDEEGNLIEGEELGTAEELLAFVSNSVQKVQEIQEKETQIRDMQNALAAYDNMKSAETHEKEIAIRELTRTLRLYEEEFHSIADATNKPNDGSVQLSMAIRSTYDGDNGTLGTDDGIKRDIASKIRAGMKAYLYDLHHTYLSKDFEIEQLRLAFHTRETEIIREKNLEISSLHKKLAVKEISIDEYEQRIEKLLQSIPGEEDEITISTGSIP